MRRKGFAVSGSAVEVRQMAAGGGDRSAATSMTQAEIERLADGEEGPLPQGWENTVTMGIPVRKQAVHIRLDADVLAWFRDGGPGYQTKINAVLRSFVQHRQQAEDGKPKRR